MLRPIVNVQQTLAQSKAAQTTNRFAVFTQLVFQPLDFFRQLGTPDCNSGCGCSTVEIRNLTLDSEDRLRPV